MRIAKFIVAAIAAGATSLVTVLGDEVITTNEWVAVALVILGALGVYTVPNEGTPNVSQQRTTPSEL
jgi:hypothetical protein